LSSINIEMTAGCDLRELTSDTNCDGGAGNPYHYWGMETKTQECDPMLRCSLAGIPAGSTIDAASLWIDIAAVHESAGLDITGYAFWIRRCRRDGTESAAWVTNQATFNIYKTGSGWGTAGCKNATTDYDATNDFSILGIDVVGWHEIPMTAFVQDCWDNHAKLFDVTLDGNLALTGANDYLYMEFVSYVAAAEYRPYLAISYTPPAGGGVILKISGESWAHVKKVSGVAEASISKVSSVVAN